MKNIESFFTELILGVAYYDEYIKEERLQEDIKLMKEAGIGLVRIAESTWSTLEPHPETFNFYHIDRVLDAMHGAGIKVMVGTPTYAIPPWLFKRHPQVMAETPEGVNQYGHRQKMDITNKDYLFYSERIIRKLVEHVCDHPAVVGYQVDNETKHYDTAGPEVQEKFIKFLQKKFNTLEELNDKFGLDYWSNRVNDWEDFPSAIGSINSSLNTAFKGFQLSLVKDFLKWQCDLIREYARDDQFITHNFDYDWRDYSFGVQKDVHHYEASLPFDLIGIDVYHPSQDELTGCEIAFCGDSARNLKYQPYLVVETQAQGHVGWLHYPGQLKLQALSHVASGASMVAYWHWHSLHNGCETYWKGILSQDFIPGRTYKEVQEINEVFKKISPYMKGYMVENSAAIMIDMHSLLALEDMKKYGHDLDYNMEIRRYYDALYAMNMGCDIVHQEDIKLNQYKLVIVPALYSVSDDVLDKLVSYTKSGGIVIYGMRSGFSDEHVKVRTEQQPGRITKSCGVTYSQFTLAKRTNLKNPKSVQGEKEDLRLDSKSLIELLKSSENTEILYSYDHPYWKEYSAITLAKDGCGTSVYVGCCPDKTVIKQIYKELINKEDLKAPDISFPIIIRQGINRDGQKIVFMFNYSGKIQTCQWEEENGVNLLTDAKVMRPQNISLSPWGYAIYLIS